MIIMLFTTHVIVSYIQGDMFVVSAVQYVVLYFLLHVITPTIWRNILFLMLP